MGEASACAGDYKLREISDSVVQAMLSLDMCLQEQAAYARVNSLTMSKVARSQGHV